MFKGTHSVTVDAKGRVAIPAVYRQGLNDTCGGRMVVTQHWHGCLLIYPQPHFQKIEQSLTSKGGFDTQVRQAQRFILGPASDADMDRQGRILVPSHLRAYAGIDGKSTLVGLGHAFEFWNEDEWEASQASYAQSLAAAADAGELPEALQDVPL